MTAATANTKLWRREYARAAVRSVLVCVGCKVTIARVRAEVDAGKLYTGVTGRKQYLEMGLRPRTKLVHRCLDLLVSAGDATVTLEGVGRQARFYCTAGYKIPDGQPSMALRLELASSELRYEARLAKIRALLDLHQCTGVTLCCVCVAREIAGGAPVDVDTGAAGL